MGNILNSVGQLKLFRGRCEGSYFVDKSVILEKLNRVIGKVDEQYICVTRPRRFGKTVMTNLISSYYAKGLPSKEIFDTLKISENEDYKKHLNQHNVISLYMSDMPEDCKNYDRYICFHRNEIKEELMDNFPDCRLTKELSLSQMFERIFYKTGECFIFVI